MLNFVGLYITNKKIIVAGMADTDCKNCMQMSFIRMRKMKQNSIFSSEKNSESSVSRFFIQMVAVWISVRKT
jgi:hypothetical protein